MGKYFGTDGVRGVANSELTVELAYLLGKYGAMVLAGENHHKPKILVGSDTRISCPMLESALVSGICSAGADVCVCDVIPTPGIAKLISTYNADAGVVISASHNSFEFNGIKFFSKDGYKLPDDTEEKIELLIENSVCDDTKWPVGENVGHRYFLKEAASDYVEYLRENIPVDLSGMKIAIDCANGATAYIAPDLFKSLGAEVLAIGIEPDGININKNCGSTHLEKLSELVLRGNCDLGIAFDGDGDRMLAVDSQGRLVDGDVIMAIVALDMKKNGKLKDDTLVVTVMSNMGLDIFAAKNGIVLSKTKVGDRYVLERMKEHDFIIGGEQSGHIIISDYSTTGDGMLSALILLDVLKRNNISLLEASKIMKVLPQVLKGIKVKNEMKIAALSDRDVLEICGEIEKQLEGKGRILVRASGTEPLIRVMLEGEDIKEITKMCDDVINIIEGKYSA